MVFENGVKNIQAVAYNGVRQLYEEIRYLATKLYYLVISSKHRKNT